MSPWRAVFQHPVEKSPFKTDVAAGFFAFNPLVTENFFPFGQEFTVESRILQKITGIC